MQVNFAGGRKGTGEQARQLPEFPIQFFWSALASPPLLAAQVIRGYVRQSIVHILWLPKVIGVTEEHSRWLMLSACFLILVPRRQVAWKEGSRSRRGRERGSSKITTSHCPQVTWNFYSMSEKFSQAMEILTLSIPTPESTSIFNFSRVKYFFTC